MNTLQFSDHLVPYEMFIKDLASQIVRFLKEDSNDPEFISQRKAFELFGRRNIERWRKMGLIEGCRKPGCWNTGLPTCDSCNGVLKTI